MNVKLFGKLFGKVFGIYYKDCVWVKE